MPRKKTGSHRKSNKSYPLRRSYTFSPKSSGVGEHHTYSSKSKKRT